VAPLTKALKGNSIWITGLRTTENRSDLSLFEYDEKFEIINSTVVEMDAKRSGDYLEKTMCRKILYTSRI
jgi:phosphoadenosine phosphosulfate reductase